ncbi:hypothetical protein Tco_1430028 [Tanacetum coccineum]
MGENVYIWDLIDFDVTMSTSRGKFVALKMLRMVSEVFCKREKNSYRDVGLGESDSKLRKNGFYKKLFKTCCMNWGEVNPTHAYYNGSCISKDIEDPSWSTSFKTRRTQKTSSALEALWKTLFVLYLYLIGTLCLRVSEDILFIPRRGRRNSNRSLGVLDIITSEGNGTAIITVQGNLIEGKAVVCKL